MKALFTLILIALSLVTASASGPRHRDKGCRDEAVRVYDYDDVDCPPQFPGGECGLLRYINQARQYPCAAYKQGIQGRVLCSFIVHPDGSISHIAVLRGVEESLNREAVRLVSEMPRWLPGTLGGRRVPVLCFLPISFRK